MQVIIWRVVRAGRRSTIGNRVMLSKVSEGSNPLLSAKKDGFCRLFSLQGIRTRRERSGRKQSGGLFSPTWQRAKRGDRADRLGKIPCSPPKKTVFTVFFLCINKNGLNTSARFGILYMKAFVQRFVITENK